MGISALSYFTIPYQTPGKEMFLKYVDKSHPTFQWLENLSYKNKPVYAIKTNQNHTHVFEIYFYRYLPERTFPSVLIDLTIPFYALQDVHPIYQDQNIPYDYVLSSVDLSSNGEVITDHLNYYYEQEFNKGYNYKAEEVVTSSCNGFLTNIYGMDKYVLAYEPEHQKFLQKYKTEDTIAFVSKKITKNCTGYYFENAKMQSFLDFLYDFQYDTLFIEFCQTTYDNTYRFCFSFDIDNDTMQPTKTAIFSVFS